MIYVLNALSAWIDVSQPWLCVKCRRRNSNVDGLGSVCGVCSVVPVDVAGALEATLSALDGALAGVERLDGPPPVRDLARPEESEEWLTARERSVELTPSTARTSAPIASCDRCEFRAA